ncbi:MAG TPA: hypothetical protein VHT91_35425, partial [Kofleriaceae bacterium]|nr:hypothetical protein [Kofleriaceae bacterium]
MARRNPPPRPQGVVRLGAAAAVALGAALVVGPGGALGPPIVQAQPAPDLARARELYRSAEAAMQDGRYDDAARDYGAAYELSADPALLYKLGHASERAGRCDVALLYYARYLREGKPTEQFTALTRERIAACGGDQAGSGSPGAGGNTAGSAGGSAAAAGTGAKATGDATGLASGASAGSAAGASSGASPPHGGAPSANAGSPPSGASPGRAGGAAASTGATSAEASAASPEGPVGAGPAVGSGSAAAMIPPTREKIAWLMGGGAIALVALGGVLAYAASSSESDVRDLYAGFGGQTPMFDAQTRKRYDDLIDQGRSYQHLSWA